MTTEDAPAVWYTQMVARQAEGLVVGARVRIIRRECNSRWCKKINAREGVILAVLNPLFGVPGWDQHDYRVWDGEHMAAGWFAAAELEILARAGVPAEQSGEEG